MAIVTMQKYKVDIHEITITSFKYNSLSEVSLPLDATYLKVTKVNLS